MKTILIKENGLEIQLGVNEEKEIGILYFGSENPAAWEILPEVKWTNSLLELQLAGAGTIGFPGMKIAGTLPGSKLRFAAHKIVENQLGKQHIFELTDVAETIRVKITWQFYTDVSILRSWVEVTNLSQEGIVLEHLSSFKLPNFDRTDREDKIGNVLVSVPNNSWICEVDWQQLTLEELGFDNDTYESSKRIYFGNTATFSSNQYLPMGILENKTLAGHYYFQLENQGAWNWEISTQEHVTQLLLSGPNDQDNQAAQFIGPGEQFTSIPIAVGYQRGHLSRGVQELTKYRRRIRRPNQDNEALPVIFNDYMNCLFGDPTTEKELPLIEVAAKVGCEVFCIDCGWYADKEVSWWPSIGDWQPSKTRFPEGITYLTNFIKEQGMVPGLWLELESAGVISELAKTKPDDWFFTRNGKRVVNRERLQLDFRNPEVRQYCFDVVKRLVEEYGVGYIKMDYNLNAGPGPELNAESVGAGLLAHNRAHLQWLKEIFAAFPDLTIENCSSGGLRMDYAMLAECSLQSVTDQTDLLKNAKIAALAATAVTPEQAAIWSYPNKDESQAEVAMNMVNAILGRIHQSGFIQEMAADKLALVAEGIKIYKENRYLVRDGLPFWPTDIKKSAKFNTYGLILEEEALLAVWNFSETAPIKIDLAEYFTAGIKAQQILYPSDCQAEVTVTGDLLQVNMRANSACLLKLEL